MWEKEKKFLVEQESIRVYFNAPAGYGNQKNTFDTLERLRKEGFKGKFQIIYTENRKKEVHKSILFLLNQPPDTPKDFIIPELGYEFMSLETFEDAKKQGKITTLNFGITAGLDDNKQWAEVLNVKIFAKIEPYTCGQANHQWDTKIYIQDQKNFHRIPNSCTQAFIPANSQTFDKLETYLQTPAGEELLVRKPGISALIHAINEKTINFHPAYGKTLTDAGLNIIHMLMGWRYAQIHSNDQKPMSIPIFGNVPPETISMLNMRLKQNDWSDFNGQGARNIQEAISKLNLSELVIASADDKNLAQIMTQNKFVIVLVGQLPAQIFDPLFVNIGKIPFIEGAGAFNLNNFNPHMHCNPEKESGISYEHASTAIKHKMRVIEEITCPTRMHGKIKAADLEKTWRYEYNLSGWGGGTNLRPHEIIGDTLVQLLDTYSDISRFLRDYKTKALKQDRVMEAIKTSVELFEKHFPIPKNIPQTNQEICLPIEESVCLPADVEVCDVVTTCAVEDEPQMQFKGDLAFNLDSFLMLVLFFINLCGYLKDNRTRILTNDDKTKINALETELNFLQSEMSTLKKSRFTRIISKGEKENLKDLFFATNEILEDIDKHDKVSNAILIDLENKITEIKQRLAPYDFKFKAREKWGSFLILLKRKTQTTFNCKQHNFFSVQKLNFNEHKQGKMYKQQNK